MNVEPGLGSYDDPIPDSPLPYFKPYFTADNLVVAKAMLTLKSSFFPALVEHTGCKEHNVRNSLSSFDLVRWIVPDRPEPHEVPPGRRFRQIWRVRNQEFLEEFVARCSAALAPPDPDPYDAEQAELETHEPDVEPEVDPYDDGDYSLSWRAIPGYAPRLTENNLTVAKSLLDLDVAALSVPVEHTGLKQNKVTNSLQSLGKTGWIVCNRGEAWEVPPGRQTGQCGVSATGCGWRSSWHAAAPHSPPTGPPGPRPDAPSPPLPAPLRDRCNRHQVHPPATHTPQRPTDRRRGAPPHRAPVTHRGGEPDTTSHRLAGP